MTAKSIIRRVETLSTKVCQEAIRIEKLAEACEEISIQCEEITLGKNDIGPLKNGVRDRSAMMLRDLAFRLKTLEDRLQEEGWLLDEVVDLIGELNSSPSNSKRYNPPDAWKS